MTPLVRETRCRLFGGAGADRPLDNKEIRGKKFVLLPQIRQHPIEVSPIDAIVMVAFDLWRDFPTRFELRVGKYQ